MKHSHSCHASDELEVGEVILIAQARVGIDLESVVVPEESRAKKKKSHFHGFASRLFCNAQGCRCNQWVYFSLAGQIHKP